MSLIICPECHKEVSDSCDTCIHCGFDLKKHKIEELTANLEELITFKSRSIAPPIVEAVLCDAIVSSFIIIFYFINWTIMYFFIVLAIVYTIMIPIATVKEIKRIVKLNKVCGKKVYYNHETNEFVFDTLDGLVSYKKEDIINFDGPYALLMTIYDNNHRKKKLFMGFVVRSDIVLLRNKYKKG